jgi:VWFA-related protein
VRLRYVRDPRSGRVEPTKTAAPLPPEVLSQLMPAHDEHTKFLQNIAVETGGSVIQVKSNKDLTQAFTAILGEFRDRYVLSYMPAGVDGAGWHEITAKVKGKSLKVTARRGYYAP